MNNHKKLEHQIIDFLDGELSAEEQEALMQAIIQEDEYLDLLNDYKAAKLQSDSYDKIAYPHKSKLLKPATRVPLAWPVGIAAALVVVVCTAILHNNKVHFSTTEQGMATVAQPQSISDISPKETNKNASSSASTHTHPIASIVPNQLLAHNTTQTRKTTSTETSSELPKEDNSSLKEPKVLLQAIALTDEKPKLEYVQVIELSYVKTSISNPSSLEDIEPEMITSKIGPIQIEHPFNELSQIKDKVKDYGDLVLNKISTISEKHKPFSF